LISMPFFIEARNYLLGLLLPNDVFSLVQAQVLILFFLFLEDLGELCLRCASPET
jgi:hypothetical protein